MATVGRPESNQTALAESEQTARAFDAAAPVYDGAYEALPGIRRMRAITSALYLEFFPPGSNLLEINCGTGNDAVFLARRGMAVLATDISPLMLEEVRKKVELHGLSRSIQTRRVAFDELDSLRGTRFDGAYSNLGGLNCTGDLRGVSAGLGALVKPGGFFIATVMPRFCLWETAAFLARFRWRDAFRRIRPGGTVASLHGGRVRTQYHSPRALRAASASYFDHVETVGLAVVLPPPNFARAYAALGKALPALERLDDAVAGLPLLRSLGDHYVMVMRRKRTA
jgi:ubiquinone/menaquinone biosynthesis C-methylase UbiE